MGLAMAASFASADIVSGTVTLLGDVDSFDSYGTAGNSVFTYDLGSVFAGYTGFTLTHIGWDVTITAEGASWQSEARVGFENSDVSDAIYLSPGAGVNTPGTGVFSSGGLIDLGGIDPSFPVVFNPDNLMTLNFFETLDDVPGVRDGFWHAGGTIDLQFTATAVPEPATMAVLGLGAAALLRRRRK
jgi:hypothetical protein